MTVQNSLTSEKTMANTIDTSRLAAMAGKPSGLPEKLGGCNMHENRHLNTMVRDHDSACTGYGVHDRVIAFFPDSDGLYCRVDYLWNLGIPTTSEILAVAKSANGTAGKWELTEVVPHANGKSTDYHFCKPSKVKP